MCGVSDFIANCKCDLDGFLVSGLLFQNTYCPSWVWKYGCEASYILQHFDLGTNALNFGVIL